MIQNKDKNPNNKQLENVRCPSCGSYGPFHLWPDTPFEVILTDNSVEVPNDHYTNYLPGDTDIMCGICSEEGELHAFTEDPLAEYKELPKTEEDNGDAEVPAVSHVTTGMAFPKMKELYLGTPSVSAELLPDGWLLTLPPEDEDVCIQTIVWSKDYLTFSDWSHRSKHDPSLFTTAFDGSYWEVVVGDGFRKLKINEYFVAWRPLRAEIEFNLDESIFGCTDNLSDINNFIKYAIQPSVGRTELEATIAVYKSLKGEGIAGALHEFNLIQGFSVGDPNLSGDAKAKDRLLNLMQIKLQQLGAIANVL